jgi:hypothetical protein
MSIQTGSLVQSSIWPLETGDSELDPRLLSICIDVSVKRQQKTASFPPHSKHVGLAALNSFSLFRQAWTGFEAPQCILVPGILPPNNNLLQGTYFGSSTSDTRN